MKEEILADFKEKEPVFKSFKNKIEQLLIDLLVVENIIVHQIDGRVKEYVSLDKKIDRKENKYTKLIEITDLVGIRIITYLDSDVDLIADLIEKEFLVDQINSIDKRKLKKDEFGYRSLHLVVSFNDGRRNLAEYKQYKEYKCEIQIRSILQHAWAEIEHDLGYKGKSAIPEEYLRDFNRLAALLETADKEFDRLKKELNNYENTVSSLIKESPESVEINQASVNSFIKSNAVFIEALELIKSTLGAKIYDATDLSGMLERFTFFNIRTIKELEDLIKLNHDEYLSFVKLFISDMEEYALLPSTLTLYYFQHFLAAKSQDPSYVYTYFNYCQPNISNDNNGTNRFVELYKLAKDQTKEK